MRSFVHSCVHNEKLLRKCDKKIRADFFSGDTDTFFFRNVTFAYKLHYIRKFPSFELSRSSTHSYKFEENILIGLLQSYITEKFEGEGHSAIYLKTA